MTPNEVLLAAARKAFPGKSWELRKYSSPITMESSRDDLVVCVKGYPNWFPDNCFDIENDWPALQIALEDDGWIFCKTDGVFEARLIFPIRYCEAKTKPDLLLAIVREGV